MKYTIVHVNDRAKDNMSYNKNILKDFDYIDTIKFFNGNLGNGRDVLNHMGIPLNTWGPYDGRVTAPLSGEYGIWISTINVWKYIVENKLDKMLMIEDDVLLKEDFVDNMNKHVQDLPEDFDFLSLYYFLGHNWELEEADIGSMLVKKSLSQYSAGQATIYSYRGAKKLLNLVHRKGIEYTADCFIFRQSLEGLINGYSIKGKPDTFLTHEYNNIQSLIDPENLRDTGEL